MSTIDLLARGLTFDAWANDTLRAHLAGLGALETTPALTDEVALLAHVYGARGLWLGRLGFAPLVAGGPQAEAEALAGPTGSGWPVWPDWSLDDCARAATQLAGLWRRFLEDLRGQPDEARALAATIQYTNSAGQIHTSRIDDVLQHLLVHGAHHRAQTIARLRAAGLEAPYIDYIHATRNGLLGELG